MPIIEFWPDYGPGPLWSEDGRVVDPTDLRISADLAARLAAWNDAYAEDKVPPVGQSDTPWLTEGRGLLAELRDAVGNQHEVVVTEPWWGEEPS